MFLPERKVKLTFQKIYLPKFPDDIFYLYSCPVHITDRMASLSFLVVKYKHFICLWMRVEHGQDEVECFGLQQSCKNSG